MPLVIERIGWMTVSYPHRSSAMQATLASLLSLL
jgi:hypothetical protein